jgi:hypothetical protein
MKKYIILLLLSGCIKGELNAQQSVIDSNTMLLNNLEARYKSPCIKYEQHKVKKKAIKVDRRIIDNLNKIYQTSGQLSDLISLLKKMGYRESSKIKQQGKIVDTVIYEKITEGQLNGYIEIAYNIGEQKLLSKKIILGTKKGFFCETKELWSNSSIDFVYLRRFIGRIKIPLQVAWSNAELESK